jgi:hypothetical protein
MINDDLLSMLSDGMNEEFSFEPVEKLDDCVGWDGYIDPKGNFYKTKPRGTAWYMGSANLHAEFAGAYLEHIDGAYAANMKDAKDYLVNELGWISYGCLILLGMEVYIEAPSRRSKHKVTAEQKKKLRELFFLNKDDMKIYNDAIKDEDIALNDSEMQSIDTMLESDPELMATVARIQEHERQLEEERKRKEEEEALKRKEQEEQQRQREAQAAEMRKKWEEKEKKRKEEEARKEEEEREIEKQKEIERDKRIAKILNETLKTPIVEYTKEPLMANMMSYLNNYNDENFTLPNHCYLDWPGYIIGDENGEPFVVRIAGGNYIPVSIVIFAKDVNDAKNKVVTALQLCMNKINKAKQLYYKALNGDGPAKNFDEQRERYIQASPYESSWSYYEDRVKGIVELLPHMKVQKYDKRLAC